MAKELMEIGGFITSGAEIVNHDASLSGNGTVDSPLGLNETVLWDNGNSFTINVPESIYNFEKISVSVHRQGTLVPNQEFYTDRISAVGGHFYTNYVASETVNTNSMYIFTTPYNVSEDGKTITSPVSSMGVIFDLNGTNIFRYKNNSTAPIFRIIGINRKA